MGLKIDRNYLLKFLALKQNVSFNQQFLVCLVATQLLPGQAAHHV